MNQLEKRILMSSVVLSGVLFVPQNVWGMHIMEGYLPPMYCAAWGALCIPFWTAGVIRIRRLAAEKRKSMLLLGKMCIRDRRRSPCSICTESTMPASVWRV